VAIRQTIEKAEMEEAGQRELVVAEGSAGRLDHYLAAELPGLSTRRAKQLCSDGSILVNGRRAAAGSQLSPGDVVCVRGDLSPVAAKPELSAGDEPLRVLYEDADLLVVSKPRLMHSVRLKESDPLTLADKIAAYSKSSVSASPDPREAGLVNRLDYETCGCALVAKNRATWELLRTDLFDSLMKKEYLALVEGELRTPTLSSRLWINQAGTPIRFSERQPVSDPLSPFGASKADWIETETVLKTLATLHPFGPNGVIFSVVLASAARAKRHQIRVHLSALGNPLTGDGLYGASFELAQLRPPLKLTILEDSANSLSGFFLLARALEFTHPQSKELIRASDHFYDSALEELGVQP